MKMLSAMLLAVLLTVGVLFGANQGGRASAGSTACEPGAEMDLSARVVDVADEGSRVRVTLQVVLSSRPALRSYRIFESRTRDLSAERARVGTTRRHVEYGREVGHGELILERSSSLSAAARRLRRRGDFLGAVAGDRLRRNPTYILNHTLVLDRGREHGLIFTAEVEDSSGRRRTVRAYAHINLIPEQQPKLLDGLVQFRARVGP